MLALPLCRTAAAALALSACGSPGPVVVSDAGRGDDAGPSLVDAAIRDGDAMLPLLWVDFAATGCAAAGADGELCEGPAPLELRFTATSPAPVTAWIWTFGPAGVEVREPSPIHRFELPGTYDVSLVVGGPGGTASASKPGFVVVVPAALGGPCAVDEQCGPDDECVCDDASACPPALATGYCTRRCNGGASCPEDAVCADLDAGGDGDWERPLCLQTCATDTDCAPGRRCRELRRSGGAGWVRGCFVDGLAADEGASCATATGALDDATCAGYDCQPLGARGLCAAPCSAGCPSYAACATFAAGGPGARCLVRCDEARPCDGDPLLACAGPGGAGGLSFTVAEPAAVDGYCAPRRCDADAECGPEGRCDDGYCALK